MGALDRIRAAAREAVEQGRAVAAQAAEHEAVRAVQGPAREFVDRKRARRDDLLARLGETAAGSAVGDGVRAAGRVAARLPLLSAPMDLFSGRNGVDALVAAVQAEPDGVVAHLWLGEALQAMQADARRFEQVRAVLGVLNPTSFVLREAARTAATLGAAPVADPATQVLARCRHLAAAALRTDPRDATALYALARVELATGRPGYALQPAKLAVAARGADRASALVVLARTYLALDRDASAHNVARKAVDAGCSLGWEVLAELLFRAPAPPGVDRQREYAALRSRVTDDDRRAYHGAYRTPGEVSRAVLDAQRRKTRDLAHHVPAYNARARTDRIELPPRP
jgi:hypothetical protein